jgi:hypothetical protein
LGVGLKTHWIYELEAVSFEDDRSRSRDLRDLKLRRSKRRKSKGSRSDKGIQEFLDRNKTATIIQMTILHCAHAFDKATLQILTISAPKNFREFDFYLFRNSTHSTPNIYYYYYIKT